MSTLTFKFSANVSSSGEFSRPLLGVNIVEGSYNPTTLLFQLRELIAHGVKLPPERMNVNNLPHGVTRINGETNQFIVEL